MAKPWTPDIVVTPEMAARLIEEQFPDLLPIHVRPFAEGWDNTAFLVNDDLVFRFPRRRIAVPLLATEAAVLPRLAERLPVPIPVPRWHGRPSDTYPWPFVGYAKLHGRSASTGITHEQRRSLARPLAAFLRALHDLPEADARDWGAGPDALNRLEVRRYAPRIKAALADLLERRVLSDTVPWASLVDSAASVPIGTKRSLVHGDLHVGHLLVDGNELTGIVDWGDVHRGHIAVDLGIVWGFLGPDAREDFFEVYGAVDDAVATLAKFRALVHATALEAYGRDRGDARLTSEAATSLSLMLT